MVREATNDSGDALSPGLEASWSEWIKGIHGIDERVRTLLRAAFEAGVEAGQGMSAAELGRRGGLKGGKARAEKLTPAQRSEIAKKGAKARWNS